MNGGRLTTARELGRAGARKILQRSGIIDESVTPLSTDPTAVAQLLAAPWYDEKLAKLADELGRDPGDVRAEAAGYKVLVVTLDTWLTGWRPASIRGRGHDGTSGRRGPLRGGVAGAAV